MRSWPCVCLLACAGDLPVEQPCVEARTAIAARSDECTGDPTLSSALLEAFDADTTCLMADLPKESRLITDPILPYECALVTRNIACELAIEYGSDLARWLQSTPTCGQILAGP